MRIQQAVLGASLMLASAVPGGRALAESGPLGQPRSAAAWTDGESRKLERPIEGSPLLLMEPRSLRSPVSVLVPGARKTVFSAALQGKIGARHYTREAFRSGFPDGWKAFYERGRAAAAEHLKRLEPQFVRDEDKVIQYALLLSDHPLTPAVLLAPGFAEMFRDKLGEQLLIAVPNRSTIVVFPKLATALERYRAALGDLYDDAIYPVSEEIFEITKDGIRVVGAFRTH